MYPGGMNPKQMAGMMRQFGIKNQELDASEVIIKLNSGKIIRIIEPQVQLIEMKGVRTYSLAGKEVEEEGVVEGDVELVVKETGVSEEKARDALLKAKGDIATAILNLSE